ncbi:hypothetical protein [Vibrio alginolyticus]|uniref:hypothetical protein n=1 Tax=Vibrio alginolyticus TaxID=663 RepID=UPI00211A0276|nr:hypothetical protein [Vibrio alginolyticus]MCQ9087130.1 hypothetical protein [Vibrio alginolyticus]
MSYSNVEAVFRLLAQLPSRYAKPLESLCEQAEHMGIEKSPDTIRRWLNVLVDLGFAERETQEGKHAFKRASLLPWLTKPQDALLLVLLHDHLFPVIPPSIAKQYQTRFEHALLEVSEQDQQWLTQIDINLPIAHGAPHLERIKQAMASSSTIRLTLIGQCLHIKPERLRLASDGVFVGYHHSRHPLQFISLTHVLDAH